MKILETVVLAQKNEYLTELISFLPVSVETVLGIKAYRFEVDSDLVILMYDLNASHIPSPVIEHLPTHLSAFLLITDQSCSDGHLPGISIIEEISRRLPGRLPTVVAVKLDAETWERQNPEILCSGIYLSEKGRIVFWNTEDAASKKQVLNFIWADLQI